MKQACLLPLRDVVVFPHMVLPLFVGRDKSIRALELAMAGNREVLLVAQKEAENDTPDAEALYDVGTIASILQLLRLPDGTIKVLVEGNYRVKVTTFTDQGDYIQADIRKCPEKTLDAETNDAMVKTLLQEFRQYTKLSQKISSDVVSSVENIEGLSRLADTIASHLQLKLAEKQQVLAITSPVKRAEQLMSMMLAEQDVLQMEKRIRGRVKQQMEKSQREYYLNEQIKAIQKELGDIEEGTGSEIDAVTRRIEKSGMHKQAREKADAELKKLRMMAPMSAEATVVRGYLDWLASIPWKKCSRISKDIRRAQEILDQDHYGLDEVKDRILEYLAVQMRVGKVKGSVLCLVGPPGVGKTSLGQSIARATNRKYVRMALGGVRDESEIRGHRRTYIGSMPGKIVQKMVKAKVVNPLFLLDEVDKMGMDMRGDPASALLEVLDPEQNNIFNDHYLEVDYDLSQALFICTSNSMDIPPALMDRMEIIRIPGYTEDEKINIARQYLLPKQLELNGLKPDEVVINEQSLRLIVRYYTREAGVRELERQLAKLARKRVKEQLTGATASPLDVDEAALTHYLGVRRFDYGRASDRDQIGQVTGLAWTSVGGELLTIEAASTPGKGRVTSTGSLGDVMEESIQAAMTVVKSRAARLGIKGQLLEQQDFHIHVPEGATPKDGPSAGIAMCTALVSVLTDNKVHANVAMTGEITLRGQVLPIGGLKEKLLAAHRGGIGVVVIPEDNAKDLKEIPDKIKADLDIHPVKWVDQVLELALNQVPTPLTEAELQEEQVWAEKKHGKNDNDRVSTH